jgi:hypothetical protein
MSDEDDQPQPTGCLVAIKRDNWPQPERAVLESREDNKVYVRAVDPCDPESQAIPVPQGEQITVHRVASDAEIYVRRVDPASPLPEGIPLFVVPPKSWRHRL